MTLVYFCMTLFGYWQVKCTVSPFDLYLLIIIWVVRSVLKGETWTCKLVAWYILQEQGSVVNKFTSAATGAEKPVKEQWAVMINVTEPVKDFHKRVPDMAYKVSFLSSAKFSFWGWSLSFEVATDSVALNSFFAARRISTNGSSARIFWKNFIFNITSLKSRVLSDLKTHIGCVADAEFFFTTGTWIGFFFLSLLEKNSQILHIH